MTPDFAQVVAWRDGLTQARAQLFQAYLARPVARTLLTKLSRLADATLKKTLQRLDQ